MAATGHDDAPPRPYTGAGRRCATVVLAGGGSRRWGGRDKTAVDLGGRPVLAHVVQGLPDGMPVVVVGPLDHPFATAADPETVRWTREHPPGGGPVAGLAAGLAALPEGVDVVVLLAGDLPLAGPAVPRLTAALHGSADQAVVGVDPGGQVQPLLAAYRVAPLRALLQSGDGTDLAGRSLRWLLGRLVVGRLPVSAHEALDLDTPADLDTAIRLVADPPPDGPAP
jgi:molybdopterin-guanine dinucleotide biosynthesis protein A